LQLTGPCQAQEEAAEEDATVQIRDINFEDFELQRKQTANPS
jgi:hypothetical protein